MRRFSAKCSILTLLLVFSSSVHSVAQTDPRPFRLGFTPFPYEVSLQAVDFTYQTIAADADLIAQHFDDGVPWPEALAGTAFHPNMVADWETRRRLNPQGHARYISVTPINFLRTGLAHYHGAEADLPLPAPWNGYTFDHPDVKKAFLNYCRYAIDFFAPDYLNIGIEVNLLLDHAPELWPAYLDLHRATYQALKADYPNLPIFVSIAATPLLADAADNDPAPHLEALREILPYSDYFALSLYPYMSRLMTGPLPEDLFERLRALAPPDKRMAIAETGYPAEPLRVAANFTMSSDTEKQADYIRRLLEAAQAHRFVFVINFVLRDYDAMWQAFGAPDDGLWLAWKDTGLYDGDGMPRPALDVWRAALAQPVQP